MNYSITPDPLDLVNKKKEKLNFDKTQRSGPRLSAKPVYYADVPMTVNKSLLLYHASRPPGVVSCSVSSSLVYLLFYAYG